MATDTLPSFAHMDPNALNVAAAANIKVLSMINETMDKIRAQESFSIVQGIKAAFGISAAMMSQGVLSAISAGIGAMGGMSELSKASSVEKNLSSEMQTAKESEQQLTEEINTMKEDSQLSAEEFKTQKESGKLKSQTIEKRNQAKDKITEHKSTANAANQKSEMRTQIWNMTTTGGKALSDGIFNTLQEQQKAVQSVASALQQMFGGSYTKAQQVLSQYLNIDFFKSLQALATAIQ